MKRPLLASLVVLLPCLAGCSGEAQPPVKEAASAEETTPKAEPEAWLEPDQDLMNFGEVYAAAVRTTSFDLVAAGTEDLVITEMKRSCGCTESKMFVLGDDGSETPMEEGHPYPPGTRFRLDTSLNTKGRYGKQEQRVHINLEGHDLPATYTLQAEIVNFIVLDPPSLDIENASTLEGFSGELLVKSRQGERFAVDVRREVLPPELTVELTPIDPDADGRAQTWNMSFAATPGVKKGLYKQKLILKTDAVNEEAEPRANGELPVHMGEVWIRTEVQGVFDIRPERLSFGRVAAGQNVARKVVIRSRDPEFTLDGTEYRLFNREGTDRFEHWEEFEIVANPLDDGHALELEIRTDGASFEGTFGGILGIRTGHRLEPEIAVPFTGQVLATAAN